MKWTVFKVWIRDVATKVTDSTPSPQPTQRMMKAQAYFAEHEVSRVPPVEIPSDAEPAS